MICTCLLSALVALTLGTPTSTSLAWEPGAPAAQVVPDILPAPKAGFRLQADKDTPQSLESMLGEYERATSIHLVIAAELRTMLGKSTCGLSQPLDVPTGQVHQIVETLLYQGGFAMTLLRAHDPVLVGVVSAQGELMRSQPYFVPESAVGSVANHPALIVGTWLRLEFINVTEATDAMRVAQTDMSLQRIVPLAGSHGIILLGRGSIVAERARMLFEMNEIGRREASQGPQSNSGASKKDANDGQK